MLVMNQPRPQAPGKDLVPDQGTPLPNNHSQHTKSGTTAIGRGKGKTGRSKSQGNPTAPWCLERS